MPKRKKHIYLLIGPIGSGKSFIGSIIHTYFNIPYIRVEDLILEMPKERILEDPEYISDVFRTIEQKIRQSLIELDQLVFQSTGLTDDFDRMFISLQSDYQVTTIKINCDPETCLERVHSRDPSNHFSFSDEIVEQINKAVIQKDFPPDYSIENIGKSSDKLKEEIRVILYHTTDAIP